MLTGKCTLLFIIILYNFIIYHTHNGTIGLNIITAHQPRVAWLFAIISLHLSLCTWYYQRHRYILNPEWLTCLANTCTAKALHVCLIKWNLFCLGFFSQRSFETVDSGSAAGMCPPSLERSDISQPCIQTVISHLAFPRTCCFIVRMTVELSVWLYNYPGCSGEY